MIKKPKLILGLFLLFVLMLGFNIGLSSNASADTDTECYVLAGGVNGDTCSGANSVKTYCGNYSVTGPTALTNLVGLSQGNGLLSRFESDIEGYASSSGNPERTGGRYIANFIDDDSNYSSSDFESALNDANSNGSLSISINCNYHFTNNTAYDATTGQVVYIGGNAYTPAVVINWGNGGIIIKLDCGNPLAQLGSGIEAFINASTTVSGTTFTHTVTPSNTGGGNATYSDKVSGCYINSSNGSVEGSDSDITDCNNSSNGASGWDNTNCGQNGTGTNGSDQCPLNNDTGQSISNAKSYISKYLWPSNAQKGDEYCERLDVNPTGTTADVADNPVSGESGWYSDNGVCIKYSPSTINASTSVTGTTFTHDAVNNSTVGPATYSYRVEGEYNGNGYSPTGCGGNGTSDQTIAQGCPLKSGSDSAKANGGNGGPYIESFTWPSNAKNGDQYCERLEVNPTGTTVDDTSDSGDSKQSDGWFSDSGACITYSKKTTPTTPTGYCYEFKGTTPTAASYDGESFTEYGQDGQPAQSTGPVSGTAFSDISIESRYGSTESVSPRSGGQTVTGYPMLLQPGGKSYDYTYYPNGTSLYHSEDNYVEENFAAVTYQELTGYDKNGNPIYTTETQPAFQETVSTGSDFSGTTPCYSGTCSINSYTYGDKGFAITEQPYTASVTFTNTSPNSDNLMDNLDGGSGPSLGYSYGGDGGSTAPAGSLNTTLGPGGSITMPVTITAGSGGMYETPQISFSYPGAFSLSTCSGPRVDVYEPFTLTPEAPNPDLKSSDEDPTSVSYDTEICNSANVAVNASSTSYAYEDPVTGGQIPLEENGANVSPPSVTASGCIYPINSTETVNPKLASGGDKYCVSIEDDYTSGYVGGGGSSDLQDRSNGNTVGPSCDTVHNEPYVQFFGNDVVGDSSFDSTSDNETCGAGGDTSGIYTYSHDVNSGSSAQAGSYSQFGTQALGLIEGLGSGGLGTNGLQFSFSNTQNNSGGSTDTANLGGDFGTSLCAPSTNYFNDEPSGTSIYNETEGIPDASGEYDYTDGTGTSTTTIGDLNVQPGERVAIFVKGDVYIDGNITYSDSGDWSSISQIPSLWIIASGNIRIAPSVTQLDGVYIAQPNSSTNSGIIDTCASVGGSYSVSTLYAGACNKQLTINGAFIDQATMLDRSFSSVRFSDAGENPQNYPSESCGTPGEDISSSYTTSTGFSTCAAEVFNFSPEVYLSQPALKPKASAYEYITSLSPVL